MIGSDKRRSEWGKAQQEIGRALTALGEREGARDKLEEGAARLRLAMDALRSTDSLAQAEAALRALQRAEQALRPRTVPRLHKKSEQ